METKEKTEEYGGCLIFPIEVERDFITGWIFTFIMKKKLKRIN